MAFAASANSTARGRQAVLAPVAANSRAPRSVRPVSAAQHERRTACNSSGAKLASLLVPLLASAPAYADEASSSVEAARAEAAAAVGSAVDTVTIDEAVESLITGIKATGEAVKAGYELGSSAADRAKEAYGTVAPYIKKASDAATPVVTEGARSAAKAAADASKALEPQFKDASAALSASAREALKAGGVDPSAFDTVYPTVNKTAESVVATSKPLLQQLWVFLTTSEPVVLAETAGVIVAAYYLGPPLLRAVSDAMRGYAGNVTPAVALDRACNSGAFLIDVRSVSEKEKLGVPDLPARDKYLEVDYAVIADRKLRGQLREPDTVEAAITAMQVAALRRLGKSSEVLLLDKNCGSAKAVARELSKRGFKGVYVVTGGYEGRGGWLANKLPFKLANTFSTAEVIMPGAAPPGSSVPLLPSRSTKPALPASSNSGGRSMSSNTKTVTNRSMPGRTKALPPASKGA